MSTRTEPTHHTITEVEETIRQRLAAAETARTQVAEAQREAAELLKAARERAQLAADARTSEIAEQAGRQAEEIRAEGVRRVARLRELTARRREADVALVLAAVLPPVAGNGG